MVIPYGHSHFTERAFYFRFIGQFHFVMGITNIFLVLTTKQCYLVKNSLMSLQMLF